MKYIEKLEKHKKTATHKTKQKNTLMHPWEVHYTFPATHGSLTVDPELRYEKVLINPRGVYKYFDL